MFLPCSHRPLSPTDGKLAEPVLFLVAVDPVFISAGASLVGVVLGAPLTWWLTLKTRREERQWTERRIVREREDAAAAALAEAIFDLMKETPQVQMPRREALQPLQRAHARLQEAWRRSSVLNDPEIYERMRALDVTMLIARQHAGAPRGAEQTNFWPLRAASDDVERALVAFRRREEPPAREFFSAEEVIEVAGDLDLGPDGLMEALLKRSLRSE